MLAALLLAAEEAAEPSKTPFYILASALVVFALIIALRRNGPPRDVSALARRPCAASSGSARCSSRARWLTAVLTG